MTTDRDHERSRLEHYKKRFVVKLRDDLDIPEAHSLSKVLAGEHWLPWQKLREVDPDIQARHVFSSLKKAELGQLVESAVACDSTFETVNLFNYLTIIPSRRDAFDTCFAITKEWGGVIEKVYVDSLPAAPPNGNPVLNTYFDKQIYHKEAPEGIDSISAWRYPGGDGSGARFIDIEQGWILNHPDLQSANIALIEGVNHDYRQHGCYVLGVVLAANNTQGIVGIAYGTAGPRIASEWSDENNYSTSNAITYAAKKLNRGDVLLVEAQLEDDLPIELKDDVWEAIRTATGNGITVVIPAGNGSKEFDSTNIQDSGAIMVAAGWPPAEGNDKLRRPATNNTNFGARIDCHAHGEDVVTTPAKTGSAFYKHFGGSSSAAAIVAGAAILIQSIAKAQGEPPIAPSMLRDLFRDDTLNTPSADPAQDKIGCMPNLAAILDSLFGPPPE